MSKKKIQICTQIMMPLLVIISNTSCDRVIGGGIATGPQGEPGPTGTNGTNGVVNFSNTPTDIINTASCTCNGGGGVSQNNYSFYSIYTTPTGGTLCFPTSVSFSGSDAPLSNINLELSNTAINNDGIGSMDTIGSGFATGTLLTCPGDENVHITVQCYGTSMPTTGTLTTSAFCG